MVLDEPTANLDNEAILRLRDLLITAKRKGKTIVIAEHRLWFLKNIVDRVIYMKEGSYHKSISGKEFFNFHKSDREDYGLRNTNFEKVEKDHFLKDGLFRVENLKFSRKGNSIIDNLSFGAKPGEILGIVGKNGSGKTTLLKLLSGLIKTDKGGIYFDNRPMKLKEIRKLVFLVMQDVNHQLFTESVIAECRLGNKNRNEIIKKTLIDMGLYEYQDSHPMALSGGQKQRLAIVSAILSNKPVILFDEPSSGLDYKHMYSFVSIIRRQADLGKIVIIVSHDNELLNLCVDRVLRLDEEIKWKN